MMNAKLLLSTALTATLITSVAPLHAAGSQAHLHYGHVMTQWGDTPDSMGLLPTALKEAQVLSQHAALSARKADDLGWIKLHNTHVMHAIDPGSVEAGPGLGYGLIKAAQGAAKHINVAAAQADASDAVKLHAEHIATSAQNAVARAEAIMELSRTLQATESLSEAADLAKQIETLSQKVVEGVDANGDGQVTWHKGEGGLAVADTHARILGKAEGVGTNH